MSGTTYEPLVVPGLLQTPDYAAEVARAARVRNRSEIDRHIATRMERQRILTRRTPPPPQYWALIDECALTRQAGPAELMRAQYERLVEAADLPNVNLQIIPLSAGLHAGMAGQFVILDFPEPVDPSTVYVETAIDGLFREKPEELARYTLIYDYLRGDAMSVDDSIAWLADRINRLG